MAEKPASTPPGEPSWQPVNSWLPIPEITRGDDVLVFEPPNIIFVNGGEQIRVIDHLSDHPILEVMRIARDAKSENVITRHPMRLAARPAHSE